MNKIALPLLLALFLTGCGHHLSGTYTGQDGEYAGMTLDFTSDTAVQVNAAGTVTPATYTLQDQQVTINDGGSVMVLTINSAGCLDGGDAIGKFCK